MLHAKPVTTRRKPTKASQLEVVTPVDARAPQPVPLFKVGDEIIHDLFGLGKVTGIRDDKLTIKFGSGTKVILETFVSLSTAVDAATG